MGESEGCVCMREREKEGERERERERETHRERFILPYSRKFFALCFSYNLEIFDICYCSESLVKVGM